MNSQRVRLKHLYTDLEARLRFLRRDTSRIQASRQLIDKALMGEESYYGINTGFGALAQTRIPPDQLAQLQSNLILSHSVGLGELAPKMMTYYQAPGARPTHPVRVGAGAA